MASDQLDRRGDALCELARLQQAYRQALADRSCQLFTLLGTAGVGKSRLVVCCVVIEAMPVRSS